MQTSRMVKISTHQIVKLSAAYSAVADKSCWIELTTTDLEGGTFCQTMFFDDPQVAKAYAEAINNVLLNASSLRRICGND